MGGNSSKNGQRKTRERDGLTKNQLAFLSAYAKCGNISRASRLSKTARSSHYEWIQDESYRAAFEDADEEAFSVLEKEAQRRAVTGTLKPIYQKGEKVGAVREYSDTLLIFLMKGRRPETYRERYSVEGKMEHEHSGQIQHVQQIFAASADWNRRGAAVGTNGNGSSNGNGHLN